MSLKDNFDYDPNSLDFKDALSFILKNIPQPNPNEAFDINAPDSLNYILAKDVLSPINIPGFNNSAMDGYGFSSEGSKYEIFKSPNLIISCCINLYFCSRRWGTPA